MGDGANESKENVPVMDAASKKSNVDYDADSITELKGLDAVRKLPGMYIGSTCERGLHHMVWEIVDNAVDEAMGGHGTSIDVRLLADGGVEVADAGRGIPVSMHRSGVPAVDVVLTSLHAGGKFAKGAYPVSGGLHGVGISVVNALSTRMEVDIRRDGFTWHQSYARAIPGTLTRGDATSATGTTVRFWPDPEIFDTTDFDTMIIAERLREVAFLNKGLRLSLRDERQSAIDAHTYHYGDGLIDFVKHMHGTHAAVHRSVLAFSGSCDNDRGGVEVDVALQWNDGQDASVQSFANTIKTAAGGTHEEGFRTALTTVVKKYAKERKLAKGKDLELTGDDVRRGLSAVISVKMAEPQFEGQTKSRLVNTVVKTIVQKTCHDHLTQWLEENPAEAKAIVHRIVTAARAHRPQPLPAKMVDGFGGLPGKLADCRSSDPRERELYVVEGDSAGGSAKSGRDSMFQAILPLRGKIINVEKMRLDRALQNSEVQAIINALGTGIRSDFDMSKLRYHKVVLMADADVDGQHISTLLLTLLFRFMRPLIQNGHVYLAQPPLYKLKWQRSAEEFAYSDRERDGLLAAGLAAGKKINQDGGVQRYKGLGEMDAKELWETTMNPAARVLRQVTVNDAAAAEAMFSLLMGEDVQARRQFITRNALDVRFLDV